MEGYIKKRYARKLTLEAVTEEGKFEVWYISHHAVTNPKKPGMVQVVFNCSKKCVVKNPNDHVYTDFDIFYILIGVLTRFRQEPVAIVADIKAVSLRAKVYAEDEQVLQFLWFCLGELDSKTEDYCMTANAFKVAMM